LLTREHLLSTVWGPGYAKATGNLRLYISQLRRKLEPDPSQPRWLAAHRARHGLPLSAGSADSGPGQRIPRVPAGGWPSAVAATPRRDS
jgi:hypothetical protein